jgi:hypothetical protein
MKFLFPALAVQAAVIAFLLRGNAVSSNGKSVSAQNRSKKRYPAVKKHFQNIC